MSFTPYIKERLDLACAEILQEQGRQSVSWLESQWQALNQSHPIVQLAYVTGAEISARNHALINADLSFIAHVDHELLWGAVNNRPETFSSIMGGLLEGFHHGSYEQWLQKMDRIQLCEIPGIYGPLYRIAGDTRHRVHTLVGLRLDAFPAEITRMEQAPTIDLTYHTGKRRGTPFFQRLTTPDIPSQMARALLHTGYLEQLDATRFQVLRKLPGPWLFSYTWGDIESASRRYQLSYPQYGSTPLEKMSLDAGLAKQFVKEHQK